MRVLLPAMPYHGSAADAVPQDLLRPATIEHLVDQSVDTGTGRLEYHYNFLIYRFDVKPTPVIARSYLLEPDSVAIQNWRDLDPTSMQVREAILYLARRYTNVQALTATGYETLELVPGGWVALNVSPEAEA